MLKKSIFGKSVPAALPMLICAGIGLVPVSAYANTIGLPDVSNPGADHGRPGNIWLFAGIALPPVSANASTIIFPATGNPGYSYGSPDHDVPPVNPPIDTPAFNKGLKNAPDMMPASVPSYTLPGADFGRVVVPVPAAVWLFGSGLLGLFGMARRKKAA